MVEWPYVDNEERTREEIDSVSSRGFGCLKGRKGRFARGNVDDLRLDFGAWMRLPPISRHVEDWFARSCEKSQSGVPRALLLSAYSGACRRDRGTLDVETVEGDLVEYLSWSFKPSTASAIDCRLGRSRTVIELPSIRMMLLRCHSRMHLFTLSRVAPTILPSSRCDSLTGVAAPPPTALNRNSALASLIGSSSRLPR